MLHTQQPVLIKRINLPIVVARQRVQHQIHYIWFVQEYVTRYKNKIVLFPVSPVPNKHNLVWKQKFFLVGAEPEQYYSSKVNKVKEKYKLIHKTTGKVYRSYYRRPKRGNWERCFIPGQKKHLVIYRLLLFPNCCNVPLKVSQYHKIHK